MKQDIVAGEGIDTRKSDRGMIIILIVLAANLRACITGVGSLIPLIRADLGISSASAGFITTLPMLIFAVISFLASDIGRRFGVGRTLMASFCLMFVAEIVRSYCGSAGLFIGTGLLAIGIGFGNVLLISMIKQRFPNRVGYVTGLYSASMAAVASLSVGVSVPVATLLGLGWRNALGMWLPLAALSIVLWGLHLRREPDPPFTAAAGEDALPYGRIAYRIPMAWCFAAFFGIQCLLFYGSSAWLPSILQSRGYSLEQAALLTLFWQALNLPTTLAVPILCARRRNQHGLILIFLGMLFLGLLGFLFAHSTVLVLVSLALFSFGMGSALGFSNTFISLRADNAQQSAALAGMGQTVGNLLGCAGPVLIGFFYDVTHAWTLPLLFLILFAFIYVFLGLFLARDRSYFREYLDRRGAASSKPD